MKTFTIFILYILVAFNLQGQWVSQTSGTTQNLICVHFPSTQVGYVGGAGIVNGTFLKTVDGGSTWTSLSFPSAWSIRAIYFKSIDTGFAISDVTELYRTTNGGSTWTYIRNIGNYSTTSYNYYCSIIFTTSNVGYIMAGSINRIWKTTNGGLVWDSLLTTLPTSGSIHNAMTFPTTNNGFALNLSGAVSKTTNAGNSWTSTTQPTTNQLYDIKFINGDTGFVCGILSGYIMRTNNAGTSWFLQQFSTSAASASNLFITQNRIMFLVSGSYVYRSNDLGSSWSQMSTYPSASGFNGINMISDSIGYVVGNSGNIYKTFPGAVAPPTTASSSLYTSNISNTSMTINWTNGNGTRRMVIARASSSSMTNPTNGTSYTANSIFGSGNTVGSGNYVVYDGTGSSCSVTGLSLSTTYFFRVYDYNGTGTTANYLTTSYASGGAATLPVNWLNFSAELKNENSIQLNWSTASEINNSHFEIERSTDNSDWTVVNTVKGNGNTNTISKYNYTDILTITKTNILYYRLKQVDFDGKFEYSKTVGVSLDRPQTNNFYVFYPNPNNGQFTIDFYDNREIKIIRLFDTLGKIVKEITTADTKTFIEANQLDKGIYLINVQSNGDNHYSKIVIN